MSDNNIVDDVVSATTVQTSCEMCILIPLLIFNSFKVLLNILDFFYRSSKFNNFMTNLFPLVKIGFIISSLLKVNFPGKENYTAHFLLAEIIVAELAFVLTLFSKSRDKLYLFFLVCVVAENLFAAKTYGSFGIWRDLHATVHSNVYPRVMSLLGK